MLGLGLNWYIGLYKGLYQLFGRRSVALAATRPRTGSLLAAGGSGLLTVCIARTRAHGCRRSRQEGTKHRSTLAFILQTSLQPHLSGSALPLPLHLVFCRSPSVAVNLHFVLFVPAVHRCFHSSSFRRNLTFVLYCSFLLLTGHQLYFPTPVSLPTSLYCLNSASAESRTSSLLHSPASLSKQPRRCSRASKCRSGKG